MYDVDRWGRPTDPDESSYWEYHLKRYVVKVTYISDEAINDDSLGGRLTKKIKQGLASEESRKQSLRVREHSKMRAAEGFMVGGFAPYGYKRMLVQSDGTLIRVMENGDRKYEKSQRVILVPGNPSEVKVLQQMFKKRANGESIRDIIEWLNSCGIPSPSRGKIFLKNNKPGKWGLNTVHKILSNAVYCGDLVYNRQVQGSWVKLENPNTSWRSRDDHFVRMNAFEPLVERDTFNKAQAKSTGRAKRKGRSWKESPYLLTGLIYCANCGYKHHGHRHNRNGTSYYYYEDSGFNLHGRSVCSQSMIPKEGLEQFVIDEISSRVLPAVNKRALRKAIERRMTPADSGEDEVAHIRSEISKVSVKEENIKDSLEKGVDPEFVADRIQLLKEQKAALENDLMAAEREKPVRLNVNETVEQIMGLTSNLAKIIATASPKRVKAALPHFVNRIEVDAKKRVATCYLYKIPIPDCSDHGFTGNRMPEVGL